MDIVAQAQCAYFEANSHLFILVISLELTFILKNVKDLTFTIPEKNHKLSIIIIIIIID